MYTFPDSGTLLKNLSAMMGSDMIPIEIISRENFIESSTFPVEIVTCKTSKGKYINLFCKYQGGMGPNNYGHRGGLEYEAKIYQHVLERTPVNKIKYFGQIRLSGNGDLLLVIEYLGESLRMFYSNDHDIMNKAAAWAGNFHNFHESNAPDFVKVYDKEYYYLWSERFKNSTKDYYKKFPWLKEITYYFEDNVEYLINCDQTIVHGEFYPMNLLFKDGIIYPVDWESAAVAPGEIDLASLIEGWDYEDVEKYKDAYKKVRWPVGIFSQEEFEKRLLLAQIYFYFWWWPENSEKLNSIDSDPLKKIYRLSKKAGVI